MSFPPYCIHCGAKVHWNNDYSCCDYGFDVEGVVGVYYCNNCDIDQYIIDAEIDSDDYRIVKCEHSTLKDETYDENIGRDLIANCLYCSKALSIIETNKIHKADVLIENSPVESCIETVMYCRNCKHEYTVVDKGDDYSTFEFRNIFVV